MTLSPTAQSVLLGLARHGATVLGTTLAGAGYLAPDKTETFVALLVGVATVLGAAGFSALQKWLADNKHAAALASALAIVPPEAQHQLDQLAALVAASPKAAQFIEAQP